MSAILNRLALAAIIGLAACVTPPDAGGPAPRTRDTLTLVIENDWFSASDNSYTNGIGLNWVSGETSSAPEDSLQRKWMQLWSFLPIADPERFETYATWTVGQEMFTPADVTLVNPPLDDQPYAGVLFIDAGFYAQGDRSCHSFKVRAGVVGPASYADDLQTTIHDLIDDDRPRGWDEQLPNEPVLNVDYTFAPAWVGQIDSGLSWRAAPVTNLSAGTYFTGASASLIGEAGWNLHEAVGLASLRRGVDPIAAISAGRQTETSFSLFLGFGGMFVAHYLPLDGTVFRDSRSVDAEPWVGFLTGGARLGWSGFSVGYQVTAFTDTFEGQTSASDFGAMTFTFTL